MHDKFKLGQVINIDVFERTSIAVHIDYMDVCQH